MKLDKEKQEIINKFDNLMRQNKEIQPSIIKKMFPDDNEDYNYYLNECAKTINKKIKKK